MAGGDRRWKVLVLGNVGSEGLDLLRDIAELTVLPEPVSAADIAACIEDMDAVLHKTGRIDAGVMSRQARLRIIARHGVGLDELDLDSIRRAGVPVSTTPGANSNAVAEATVGMALNVLRHFPRSEAMIKRDRAWKRESLMGRELGQAVVGIVGFGQIGRLAARYFIGRLVLVPDVLETHLLNLVQKACRREAKRLPVRTLTFYFRLRHTGPGANQAKTLLVGGRPSTRTRRISAAACTAMAVCA